MRPPLTQTPQVNQGKRMASGAMRTRLSRDNTNAVKKARNSITWGITIISAISLTLTLLGYGVAMAVETPFGLPHQTVYTSVLDLLGLSVYAMISLVLGIDEIKWQPMLEQAWQLSLVATAGMFIFICGLLYSRTRQAKTLIGPNSFWRYFWRPTKHGSSGRLLAKGVIESGLFGGFIFISPFLVAGVLTSTVILISIVPIPIVLFEPVSGSARRVPIGELTVQAVDHVPAINPP